MLPWHLRYEFEIAATDSKTHVKLTGIDARPTLRESIEALPSRERALLGEHLPLESYLTESEPEQDRSELSRHPDAEHYYEPPLGGFGPCIRCGDPHEHERHLTL